MRFFLLASLCVTASIAAASQNDDFLAARDAFAHGNTAQLDHLADRFAHSPLEPYVTYYQLRMRLDTADASVIKRFLARPEDTPMIDRLRVEWLKRLGQNQKWDDFLAEYPHVVNADAELTCYALLARNQAQEEQALQEARRLWFSNDDQPESCGSIFAAAQAMGFITREDVWQRTRQALEAGNISLARQLSEKLAPTQTLSVSALHGAYDNPGHYLSKVRLEDATEGQRAIALFALRRLAKQSPQLAVAHWSRIAAYFPEAEQRYWYGWLGYEASRKQDPRALEWYQRAGDQPLTDLQLAWRTRAALRLLNWREVLVSINTMQSDQQREKAWRYWKARALKALGKEDEAEAMLTALSSEYGYYGQLASEELGSLPGAAILSAHYPIDQEEIDAVLAQPGIQRALMLYQMELSTEGAKEWSWAVRKFDDKQLLAAAEVARRNGIYDRSIDTAERTVQLHDFNLRFPTPYRTELQAHLRENELDEAWVYGLMRQESRFVTRAKSAVGAAGLMQIMPQTARWAARQLHLRDYRKTLIHDMEMNLKLGTYYLKSVLSSFDNNPVLASAAYNAGPARARQWLAERPLEGAIYIETIPFDETRDYVKKVMSNTVYYSKLFGQPPASLKQRLGTIASRNAANEVASADGQ